MKQIVHILLAILFISSFAQGEPKSSTYTNDKALRGVDIAKAYFDVTVGNPSLLLLRLQLVEKTYNQLQAAGVRPEFVIGIRGKASNFFTNGNDYVLDVDLSEKEQITKLVKKLKKLGTDIEQCRIAADLQEIAPKDFLPEISLVANGYVSMIGYHAQGYGLVPMD